MGKTVGRIAALALVCALTATTAGQAAPSPPDKVGVYRIEVLETGALTPEVTKKLEPLKTLQAVETLLKASDMAFSWGRVDYPAEALGEALVRELEKLPPGEVFVVPREGAGTFIGVILGRR